MFKISFTLSGLVAKMLKVNAAIIKRSGHAQPSGRQVDPSGLVSQSLPELVAVAIELFGDSTTAFVRSGSVRAATRPPARTREAD